MEEIGTTDAKRRFSEIARRVKETGQPARVTIRGEEMVDITPIRPHPAGRRTKEQAFAALAKLRRELPKSSAEQIRADIADGRR